MLQNAIYAVIKVIVGSGLRIFFQEIQVRNLEQIPTKGPFIVTSNHPNDKLDALIIGRSVPRKIHFLAAGFLFEFKVLNWIFRSTGTIPVYRKHESTDAKDQNIKSFAACFEVLEKKGAIAVFPEGATHLDRQVKQLKTGTSRIAFEAEAKNNWQLGLKIVPVGLNFYHPTKIRGKVFVNFGKPIPVADFRGEYEQDPEKAIHQLTHSISRKIQDHIIHLESESLQQLLGDLEHIYKGHLSEQLSQEAPISEFIVSKRIAEAVQYYYENDPVKIAQIWGMIENYKRKLRVMGVGDTIVREYQQRGIIIRGLLALFTSVLGMPIALYGWLNSLPAIILTLLFSHRKANTLTKIALIKFMTGLLIFPIMYILQILAFNIFFITELTLAYAISLPLTGYFTLYFHDKFKTYKRAIYQAYIFFTKRPLILSMQEERVKLIRYFNELKDQYMVIRDREGTPR
jgi:1-acyl-sn-glycerol-3-phosphate acyltransferase